MVLIEPSILGIAYRISTSTIAAKILRISSSLALGLSVSSEPEPRVSIILKCIIKIISNMLKTHIQHSNPYKFFSPPRLFLTPRTNRVFSVVRTLYYLPHQSVFVSNRTLETPRTIPPHIIYGTPYRFLRTLIIRLDTSSRLLPVLLCPTRSPMPSPFTSCMPIVPSTRFDSLLNK